MIDLSDARENMVESQVRPSDVTDPRITHAMRTIPRELFIPKSLRSLAYSEEPVEIAQGRVAMEPRTLAKLLHAANVKDTDLVLLIGGATGYTAALLSHLAAAVVALEDDKALVDTVTANCSRLDIDTVASVEGPLTEGHPSQAPYDLIVLDGGIETVPPALLSQLAEGGRLVAIVRDGPVGKARLFLRSGDAVSSRYLFDATVPILPGFEKPKEFAL